ncbi:DUF805 domain-containing protein [Nostoc sp. 3335mG]|nr:DUF805 domain-containing protein [Nostoc sp. 3335mG]
MEWMILPLKRYAQFSGRSTRREFWMWILFYIICVIVLSIIDGALGLGGANRFGGGALNAPGTTGYGYGASTRGGLLTWIFGLAVLVPNIAVAVRRLHDTNRSGWWILMPMVPYLIGAICFFAGLYGMGGMTIIGSLLMFAGFVCAIVLLVWYCMRGTAGPNRFGPDPLAPMGDLHETFS